MQVRSLIEKKRSGGTHTEAELRFLIESYVHKRIPDYQIAAWLMAVFFRGMDDAETESLTTLMWKSGVSFPRADQQKQYWVDKHSTGGVGDKTSLLLVPWVTATAERVLGPGRLKIPMISGRGLGFTGGTLDKLESVPGFHTRITLLEAESLLQRNGFFMMGQTKEVAPADGLLYSLRDATATVESIPLIVASILSKKLAESLDGLVFDVKYGGGSFMGEFARAKELAQALVGVARKMGKQAVAVLSDMDEPLGRAVGHSLEVQECYAFFSEPGSRESRLFDLTLELGAWMIHLASANRLTLLQAREALLVDLNTPRPLALFRKMFEAQQGNFEEFLRVKPESTAIRVTDVKASASGYVSRLDARRVAMLVNDLGGGRSDKESPIDREVGIEMFKRVGDKVAAGETLARVHARPSFSETSIQSELSEMVRISPNPAAVPAVMREVIT